MSQQGEAALVYANCGLVVLPLHWPTDVDTCSCGCSDRRCWQRAKHPLVPPQLGSSEPSQVNAWWERWPLANVGLLARESLLVVVDLDLRPGHGDVLKDFRDAHGDLVDETVVAMSGKGYHLYFRAPSPPARLFGGKDRLGPGIDVITDRYAVAPPSTHHNLRPYRWRAGSSLLERSPATLPADLAARLGRRPGAGWYIRNAPYPIADALHLPMGARATLRRIARRLGIEA